MPAANVAARAGESQITAFDIFSNYGDPVNVSNGIIELDYYESLLDNTVRATATFADTGFRDSGSGSAALEEDDLKLTAGEKVHIKVVDGNGFTLDLTGTKHLRVKEVKDIQESTNNTIFTIDLYSKECIDNQLEKCRVKTRFDGKPSDHVEKILTEILKTEKEYDIDPTLNNLNFVGTTTKPFYQMTWLGPRSVPDIQNAKGILAGYFFYETYDGYKFKSIDKLFQQEPKKRLLFNNLIGEVPDEYDGKILEYSFDSTMDLDHILPTGSQTASKAKVINALDSSFRESVFEASEQISEENIGGTEQPKIATDLNLQEESCRIFYSWDDQGFLPEGNTLEDQLKKSTFTNYNNDEILRQSSMRYNNLFSTKLSIAIAGDMNLRAGDLIHCDFPEVTSNETKSYSQKKSGIYMIIDVCHRVTKNNCYTRLNLTRESIGRKPA